MKKLIVLSLATVLIIAAMPKEEPADTPIKGSWQMVKSKYDTAPMKDMESGVKAVKMFTGTRWSAAFFNIKNKEIQGTCGGSYVLKGDQYLETVEYYSWDAATTGKVFTFSLKMEDGMLHQIGYIEYKGNNHYLIDEWYKRID